MSTEDSQSLYRAEPPQSPELIQDKVTEVIEAFRKGADRVDFVINGVVVSSITVDEFDRSIAFLIHERAKI